MDHEIHDSRDTAIELSISFRLLFPARMMLSVLASFVSSIIQRFVRLKAEANNGDYPYRGMKYLCLIFPTVIMNHIGNHSQDVCDGNT